MGRLPRPCATLGEKRCWYIRVIGRSKNNTKSQRPRAGEDGADLLRTDIWSLSSSHSGSPFTIASHEQLLFIRHPVALANVWHELGAQAVLLMSMQPSTSHGAEPLIPMLLVS